MKPSFFRFTVFCVGQFFSFVCYGSAAEWVNASKSITIELRSGGGASAVTQNVIIGGNLLDLLGHSSVRRENHGFGWLAEKPGEWVNDRFLVFQDEDGLCIIDGLQKLTLINQVFAGFSESPLGAKWAALRFRPTARNQEQLNGSEKDTLWFLDPSIMAQKRPSVVKDDFFDHLPIVRLDGVSLVRPIWTEDGSGVVVALYRGDGITALLYDVATQKLKKTVRLGGLQISPVQALSPWISKEIESSIAKAIATSGILQSSGEVKPEPNQNKLETAQSATHKPLGEQRLGVDEVGKSSKTRSLWPWAACGIGVALAVWALIKRRAR
jgi:hypothetical protein